MVELQPAPPARQASKFTPPQAGLATGSDSVPSYFVYILCSRQLGKHYTGHSQYLGKRQRQHRRKSSHWTGQANDWIELWHTRVDTRQEAAALERRIKRRGASRFLERLSNGT